MNDKIHTVQCDCGFKLGIQDGHLEEVAAGVWGTIPCPKCKTRLNDKIQKLEENLTLHSTIANAPVS